MFYEYHIQEYNPFIGWEGDGISGDCKKRNDAWWLKKLKRPGTRMVLYIKDEDHELQDIITLRTL